MAHPLLFSDIKGWTKEHSKSVAFEDINADGFHEMIFTGPRGINFLSFDKNINQWIPILDDYQINIAQRYSEIMDVIPANLPAKNNSMVFIQYANQLHWANVITTENGLGGYHFTATNAYTSSLLGNFYNTKQHPGEALTSNANMSTSSLQAIPQIIHAQLVKEKPVRLLRDDLDCSSMMNAIDKYTGRVNFQLPLIDLFSGLSNDISLKFIYNGINQQSDVMGIGWSLPQNFITMRHQSSIYEESEAYYIVMEDIPTLLILDSDNSNKTIYTFKLTDNSATETRIRYYKTEEKWEIKGPDTTQIYGRTSLSPVDPIIWEICWENWRGLGSSSNGQTRIATSWYLAEVHHKNNVFKMTYDVSDESVTGGNTFTREIYLKSVTSLKNEVTFKYSSKQSNEYKAPKVMDENGFIRQQLVISRYLSGYTVSTPNYHQNINFIYNMVSEKRFLTKISQEHDFVVSPILQFGYNAVSKLHLLGKVILPSEAQIKFEYKSISEVSSVIEQLGDIRIDIPSNSSHSVNFIKDDVIVNYIDKNGKIVFQSFKQDSTADLSSVFQIYPNLGRGSAKGYNAVPLGDHFAIVIHDTYTSQQELHLLYKPDKKWMKTSEFAFNEDAVIKFGRDFMITYEKNSPIYIIEWDKSTKKWRKEIFKTDFPLRSTHSSLVAVYDNTFIVYNNDIIWIAFKDQQKWHSKKIKDNFSAMDCVETTLNKFHLNDATSKRLWNLIETYALSLYNNLFSLGRWCVEGGLLYTIVDLFVLNNKYDIAESKQIKVLQENLFELELASDDLVFAYKLSNSKFDVFIKDIQGSRLVKIHKEIDEKKLLRNLFRLSNSEQKKKAVEDTKAELSKGIDQTEIGVLFDERKYVTFLNFQILICGNKTFTFTGTEWKEDAISMKKENERNFLVLGDKLLLAKETNYSPIKLYRGADEKKLDRSLVNLRITDFHKIYNAYPIFLAYQEEESNFAKVIRFSNDGEFEKVISLPLDEKLTPWSKPQMLVSSIENIVENQKKTTTLVFHQMFGLNRLLPNPVITKSSLQFENDTRSTAYEYKLPRYYNGAIYYEELFIIPGSDKTSFGWIKEERNFTKSLETQRKFFDGQGNLIKTQSLKQEPKENNISQEQENLYSNATIFDASNNFKVAEFFTSDVSDEEVGYYGFEKYEVNRIGTNDQAKKWIFKESDVVKNGFSFTGQNYLRLSNSTLYGIFQPKHQDQDYIAACWIRPQNEISDESTNSHFLTANIQLENDGEIYNYTRSGQVKYKFENWYYVEVLIEFPSLREALRINENSTVSQQLHKNLQASIVISPNENSTIDIDHIRFSPLNSPFHAIVYNLETMQIKDEIRHDGLIKRRIYGKNDEQIASIDENGHLEVLKICTKASSIGRIVHLNSITQIQPEDGFYELFSPSSFEKRWKIENVEAWQISPNQLNHFTTTRHNLFLNPSEIDSKSFGLRIYVTLDPNLSFLQFGKDLTLMSSNNVAEFIFLDKRSPIPLHLEILIAIENTRLFIWIDGGMYFDGSSNGTLINKISVRGNVTLSDVIVFNKPSIRTTYYNSLQEKVQEIELENENSAILKEYLYDELGREAINVQPARIMRSKVQSLLSYHPTFVTNKNFFLYDAVWKTGRLKGESKDLLGEYGYSQIKYFNNPLNEKNIVGLPGKEFSIFGPYAKLFESSSNNLYINNVYPIEKNYIHQVECKPGNVKHITVLNNMKNIVAKYIEIPNAKDILVTYEHDSKGNVIKVLPPLYHEKTRTLMQINLSPHNDSVEQDLFQKSFGTFATFNKNNDVITYETPDSQKIEHIYEDDLLKFTIFYNQDNRSGNVTYFNYDGFGRLSETGELTREFSKQNLMNLTLTENDIQVYQQFNYNDFEREPTLRKKTKKITTYNEGNPLIEEFTYTTDQEIFSKKILNLVETDEILEMMKINKLYNIAGKVTMIEYPANVKQQLFKLVYKYNKLGLIVGIGVPGNEDSLVKFSYNAAGQIVSEEHLPHADKIFTREYSYNSAGFLTRIKDKFLTEEISYTENSYGGRGYSDGTVTATRFEAKWHKNCDDRNLKLNEHSFIGTRITSHQSQVCFHNLKQAGYLDSNNHQAKVFYPKLHPDFPISCTSGVESRRIQSLLGMKGFPSNYGYLYDYGNLQELTKAKYFAGNEMPRPLQPDTFNKEIPGLNITTSRDIWKILYEADYIVQIKDKFDLTYAHGKQGKSFIRSMSDDLENIGPSYTTYDEVLQGMLASCMTKKLNLSQIKSSIQLTISKWIVNINETRNIMDMLKRKQYLDKPFTTEFYNILKKYESYIPDVVRVLQEHFGKALGEAEFDVESYDIDVNGNHKLFYSGFDHFQLNYKDDTNQINNISYHMFSTNEYPKNFDIKHDDKGNVIRALHKGIQSIKYHLVSNRPIKIELEDESSLIFHYDMQGERILKRVVSSEGKTITETHYFRDELGKPLVEKKITYISPNLPPDVLITTYIYGPRGLIGFIRDDQFYSLFADHEGSIRLVIRDGEVVAAYDYLPYGNIMRKYGNNPESHISYLYTGQELDEETGLYNFHARFYDPSIGRFYQIDPMQQYFSPYKYAGNSPVSMIDTNGEIAIIIPIIFAVVGAYLGASGANNNFNPLDWELDSPSTWAGLIGGGIAGAFLPYCFVVAPSLTLALGAGASYLNTAGTNQNWNPLEWKNDARTIDSLFQGFSLGAGLKGGTELAVKLFSKLSTPGRIIFWGSSAMIGGGIAALNANATNWNFSNPAFYSGVLNGIAAAPDLPMLLYQAPKYFFSHGKTLVNALKNGRSYQKFETLDMETVFSIMKSLPQNGKAAKKLLMSQIWRNTAYKHPITISAIAIIGETLLISGGGYLMFAATREKGATMNSIFHYHAMISGMSMVGQLTMPNKYLYPKLHSNEKNNPLIEHANGKRGQINEGETTHKVLQKPNIEAGTPSDKNTNNARIRSTDETLDQHNTQRLQSKKSNENMHPKDEDDSNLQKIECRVKRGVYNEQCISTGNDDKEGDTNSQRLNKPTKNANERKVSMSDEPEQSDNINRQQLLKFFLLEESSKTQYHKSTNMIEGLVQNAMVKTNNYLELGPLPKVINPEIDAIIKRGFLQPVTDHLVENLKKFKIDMRDLEGLGIPDLLNLLTNKHTLRMEISLNAVRHFAVLKFFGHTIEHFASLHGKTLPRKPIIPNTMISAKVSPNSEFVSVGVSGLDSAGIISLYRRGEHGDYIHIGSVYLTDNMQKLVRNTEFGGKVLKWAQYFALKEFEKFEKSFLKFSNIEPTKADEMKNKILDLTKKYQISKEEAEKSFNEVVEKLRGEILPKSSIEGRDRIFSLDENQKLAKKIEQIKQLHLQELGKKNSKTAKMNEKEHKERLAKQKKIIDEITNEIKNRIFNLDEGRKLNAIKDQIDDVYKSHFPKKQHAGMQEKDIIELMREIDYNADTIIESYLPKKKTNKITEEDKNEIKKMIDDYKAAIAYTEKITREQKSRVLKWKKLAENGAFNEKLENIAKSSFENKELAKEITDEMKSSLTEEIERIIKIANIAPFEPWVSLNCGELHAGTPFTFLGIIAHSQFTFRMPIVNVLEPFSRGFELIPAERCTQCKFTSHGVITYTDFKQDAEGMLNELFNLISNPPTEKKRRKRSVLETITRDEFPTKFSYKINVSNVDSSEYIEKKDVIHAETNQDSSWMNNWFSWLINTTGGLFNANTNEIRNESSSESVVSQLRTQFDTNGTILLLDLLVRKVTGEKFFQSKDHDQLSPLEIQGHAIGILSEFEDILNRVAVELGIPVENLSFDPIAAQKILIDQLRDGKFSKISQILYLFAKKANPYFERNLAFLTKLKYYLKRSFDTISRPEPASIQKKLAKHRIPARIQQPNQNFIKTSNTTTHSLFNKSNIMLVN